MLTHTLPEDCAAAISELDAAGPPALAVFAGFAGAAAGAAAAGAAAGADAAGALAGFDAAAGAAAGAAAAGALAAVLVSSAFFFRDLLVVVAEVSLLAAGAALAAGALLVLAALASSAFFFRDFLVVVADVSLLAADLSLAAAVSSAAAFFLRDFLVVVVVSVLVELACAAAITGMKARTNAKDNTVIHKLTLYREFIISYFLTILRGHYAPYFLQADSLNLSHTKRLRGSPQNITSPPPQGQQKLWLALEIGARPGREGPSFSQPMARHRCYG